MKLQNCLKKSTLSDDAKAALMDAVNSRAEGEHISKAAILHAEAMVEDLEKTHERYLKVLKDEYDKQAPAATEKVADRERWIEGHKQTADRLDEWWKTLPKARTVAAEIGFSQDQLDWTDLDAIVGAIDTYDEGQLSDEIKAREPATRGAREDIDVYYSGSERVGNIEGQIAAGVRHMTASINELSGNARNMLVNFVNDGGSVMLDSGAFAVYKKAYKYTQDEWIGVLSKYREFLDAVDEDARERVSLVAPDIIGNQERTLAIQNFFRDRLSRYVGMGANLIVPIQKGEKPMAEVMDFINQRFGGYGKVVVGIPSNVEAFDFKDIRKLMEAPLAPKRIHLLGMSGLNNKIDDKIKFIRKVAGGEVEITADATILRSATGEISETAKNIREKIRFGNVEVETDVLPEWIAPQLDLLAREYFGETDETETWTALDTDWTKEQLKGAINLFNLDKLQGRELIRASDKLKTLVNILAKSYGMDTGLTKAERGAARADAVTQAIGGEQPAPAEADEKYGTPAKPNILNIARAFAADLRQERFPSNKVGIQQRAAELFGMTRAKMLAARKFKQKPIEEALEYAVVMRAREIARREKDPVSAYRELKKLHDSMPNLATRSSGSVEKQQYSTPVHLAYLAQRFAGVSENAWVYEPNGGTGMLLTLASPHTTWANEISNTRHDILRDGGFMTSQFDAAGSVANTTGHPRQKAFDSVVANPPFGSVAMRKVQGYNVGMIEHIHVMNALTAMKDDGKAAFIIGGENFKDGEKMLGKQRNFLNWLYRLYNVKANIDIPGEAYAKQGASYPIRLIVVHGRKQVPQGFAPEAKSEYKQVKSIDDILPILTEVGYEQPASVAAQPSTSVSVGAEGARPAPAARGESAAGNVPGLLPGQDRGPGAQAQPSAESGRRPDTKLGGETLATGEAAPGRGSRPATGTRPGERADQSDVGVSERPAAESKEGVRDRRGERPGKREGISEGVTVSESEGVVGVDNVIDDLLALSAKTAKEQKAKEKPAEEKPAEKEATARPPRTKAQEGAAKIAAGINKFNDILGEKGELGPGEFKPELWPQLKEALHEIWEGMKLVAESVKDAAQRFIREAYSMLSAKGKPYIDKFIQTEIRADLMKEAEDGKKPESPAPTPGPVEETEYQVVYTPKSKGPIITETLCPRYMQEAMGDALGVLEAEVGDIDDFVTNKLQYDNVEHMHRALSGDQVDAVALSIKHFDDGNGMVIGDQTGVGKGRVAAAMLRYGQTLGLKPMFFTEKANLFTDFYRDIVDIDHTFNPFIVNTDTAAKIFDQNERPVFSPPSLQKRRPILRNCRSNGVKALGEYDCILTTYTQVNRVGNLQQQAFRELARGNMVIMDESHNAGGESNTGAFLRDMLVPARGVTYLSATFAKRPENMPIYFRTGMSQANLTLEEIIGAMKNGGLPLQEVVARDLSSIGQYIRRELSFAGIPNDYIVDSKNAKRDENVSNQMTQHLRDILHIDHLVGDVISGLVNDVRNSGGMVGNIHVQPGVRVPGTQRPIRASVNTANFASTVHNAVRGLLFSMKADVAVTEALTELEDGNKVTISLANTFGSFIQYQMEHGNFKEGDPFDLTFADVLKRYLRRTLQFTVTQPNGDKDRGEIPIEQLPPHVQEIFRGLDKRIEETVTHLPGSPIDYIRQELIRNDYKVGELTGREWIADLTDPEKPVLVKRDEVERKQKQKTVAAFNRGDLDVVILNQAGSTGISMHASSTFADKRTRVNIIAQPELEINTEVQKMGRINRKGQVHLPRYKTLLLDIPAEIRPTTVLMKKLSSLSANTSANADSPLAKRKFPDMMNRYGDRVTQEWLSRLTNPELAVLGVNRTDDLMKVSGRMALQPVNYQRRFFEEIEDDYNALIEDLKEDGLYDLEMTTTKLAAKTVAKNVITSGTNEKHPFGRSTYMETLEAKNLKKPFKKSAIDRRNKETLQGKTPEQYSQELINTIRSQAEAYVNEANLSLTDEQRQRLEEYTRNNMDQLRSELLGRGLFKVGNMIGLRGVAGMTQSPMNGIVTDVRLANGSGNPVNGSRVRVVLAINNNIQKYTVPISKFRSRKIQAWQRDRWAQQRWDDYLEDQDSTTRHMITGNLLQGFANAPAGSTVVRFTMEDNSERTGILTPLNFDLGSTPDQVRLNSGQAVKAIENKHVRSIVGATVEIREYRGNRWSIRVPRTRARGGPFFLDDTLRGLTETGDFETVGNQMRAYVEQDKIGDAIRRVYQLGDFFSVGRNIYDRIEGGQTRLAMGSAPGTDVTGRTITRNDVKRAQQVIPIVKSAMAEAGLPQEVIDRIDVELKPIIDLRGKDIDKTLDEWAKERMGASAILGATTFRKLNALMELSLEQDLSRMDRTAYHESFHVAARWVLPPGEYGRIMRHYKTEEGAAEAFADYISGRRQAVGLMRRIFNRIKAFLQRLGNALRGKGFSRPEDIFEGIRTRRYRPHFQAQRARTTTALEREKRAAMWYSQMGRVLDKKLPNKGKPKQFMEIIDNLAGKGKKGAAFKPDELEWSGLESFVLMEVVTDGEFVSVKPREQITKAQVIEHIKNNFLIIKEEVLGTPVTIDTGDRELPEPMNWAPNYQELTSFPDDEWLSAEVAHFKEEYGDEYRGDIEASYRRRHSMDEDEALDDTDKQRIEDELNDLLEKRANENWWEFNQEYSMNDREYGYEIVTTNANDYYNVIDPDGEFMEQFTTERDAMDYAEEQAQNRFGTAVYEEADPYYESTPFDYLETYLPGYGLTTAPGGLWSVENTDGETITRHYEDEWEAVAEAMEVEGQGDRVPMRVGKWMKDSYNSPPGLGSNYRELLLTLKPGIVGDQYKSGHYSEAGRENLVVHVRFDVQTDANGQRVLFIQEIQSDWHQTGRQYGYKGAEAEWKAFEKEVMDAAKANNANLTRVKASFDILKREPLSTPERPTEKQWEYLETVVGGRVELNQFHDISDRAEGGPPTGPFMTTWPQLALKRMVRYAAEKGFDRIGWTPGVFQVERWEKETRRRVDKIIFNKKKENEVTNIYIAAHKGQRRVFDEVIEQGGTLYLGGENRTLEQIVGKDIARKIEEADENRQHVLEGDDLTIGGEGMKGFYDRMIPAILKQLYGKKSLGSPKVQVMRLASDGHQAANDYLENRIRQKTGEALVERQGPEVWFFPITREMRDMVLGEGQTLFRLGDIRERLRSWFSGRRGESSNVIANRVMPEHVRERYKKAGAGITRGPLFERMKAGVIEAMHTFTPGRMFPKLDKRKFAKANEIFRNVLEIPAYSKWFAASKIRDILDPDNLTPEDYEAFSLKIVLDDFLRDTDEGGVLENWEEIVEEQGELAFGFQGRDEIEQAIARLDEIIDGNTTVQDALMKRESFMTDLRRRLVDAKMLKPEVLNDPRYFHHQVLEYANAKYAGTGTGTRDVRVHKKGYQIHRIGSTKEYSTNYLQSEFEVVAQGIAQLEMKKNLDEIGDAYNIQGELKAQARFQNYVAVVGGPENYQRLGQLREEKYDLEAQRPLDRAGKERLAAINQEIWELDPTMPARQKIAIGLARLGLDGDSWIDEGDINFELLNRLADQGEIAALTVFRGIADRNNIIKETLGRQIMTWQKLVSERAPMEGSNGWAVWRPRPGTAWYMTNSVNDKILEQVLAGNRELEEPDVKKVLARGADVTWVVPAEVAEVMDGEDFINFMRENVVSRAAERTLNWWKRWILINPARIFKYNLNNLSGDFDITFAYDPKINKYTKKAAKDLWAFHYNKPMDAATKSQFEVALRDGAVGSGMTVHDIPDIGDTPQLAKLMRALEGNSKNGIKYIERFWEGSKNFTTWRENVLRLASYRFFLDEIAAGNRRYGASIPEVVDATTDRHRKAALLARELVGDYGGLSRGGQWLRRKIIPFYSWLEINTPRYYRMFKNLAVEGEPSRGRGLRAGAILGKKTAFLTAKVFMLYAAVQLFNRLFWPDEEEELGEVGRRQLHLILGRRADGSIMTLRFQGALSDALSWFNLHDFPQDIKELATGKKTVYQWGREASIEGVNKLIQGTRPDIKVAGEIIAGRQLFPEFWRPRPIRDKWEHAARMFSLEKIYRRVAGKPIRGEDVGARVLNDLASLFTYSADPGEVAYHSTRRLVSEFLEENNLEKPLADPTTRSNALYYYKQAIKFGDAEAAEKYLAKYKELGGKMKYLRVSIKRAHPLSSLPRKKRTQFYNRLTGEEKQTIKRATEWYKSTYRKKK